MGSTDLLGRRRIQRCAAVRWLDASCHQILQAVLPGYLRTRPAADADAGEVAATGFHDTSGSFFQPVTHLQGQSQRARRGVATGSYVADLALSFCSGSSGWKLACRTMPSGRCTRTGTCALDPLSLKTMQASCHAGSACTLPGTDANV